MQFIAEGQIGHQSFQWLLKLKLCINPTISRVILRSICEFDVVEHDKKGDTYLCVSDQTRL